MNTTTGIGKKYYEGRSAMIRLGGLLFLEHRRDDRFLTLPTVDANILCKGEFESDM